MNHLKYFCKKQGITQAYLAEQVGVARQTISLIENNKYNPSLELCINLALSLNTDLNSLFWEEKNNF